MPKPKDDDDLVELAKRGARAQLGDLVHEIKMLLELFPHLHDSFDKDELPLDFILKRGSRRAAKKAEGKKPATPQTAVPKGRLPSAAAGNAMSNAQKKRRALAKADTK